MKSIFIILMVADGSSYSVKDVAYVLCQKSMHCVGFMTGMLWWSTYLLTVHIVLTHPLLHASLSELRVFFLPQSCCVIGLFGVECDKLFSPCGPSYMPH